MEFPTQDEIRKWEHLKDIQFGDYKDMEVGLLLGSDAFLAMEPLEVVPSAGKGSPFAVRTRYGWVVSGLRDMSSTSAKICKTMLRPDILQIEQLIQQLYNKEHEESLHSTTTGPSLQDKAWTDTVNSSVRLVEGHYEVGLPVCDNQAKLPNNRAMATSRLKSLGMKFKKDERLASDYKRYIGEMLRNDFAERVPVYSHSRNDGKCWYLPHHAVRYPQKPEMVRIIFDGAAKYKGVSLNDSLLQGPDQTNSLLDVLTRFRMDKVAFTADIENMFHQVRVPASDRDYFRFLW